MAAASTIDKSFLQLRTALARVDEHTFSGYVLDENDLTRKFVVECFLDGYPLRTLHSNAYVAELAIEGVGDGCYGFSFSLPSVNLSHTFVVEVRVANIGVPVGTPILLNSEFDRVSDPTNSNCVRWLGGLRFEGWSSDNIRESETVTAVIDGEHVASTKLSRWTHIGAPEEARLAKAFDLFLPEKFADGNIRQVKFIKNNGDPFYAGALSFFAFDDSLEIALSRSEVLNSQKLRGRLFDLFFPKSVPFCEYSAWRKRYAPVPGNSNRLTKLAIVLVGPGDMDVSLRSLETNAATNWVAAALPHQDNSIAFDTKQLKRFLSHDARQCKFVVFGLAGTQFDSSALGRILEAFRLYPQAKAVYSDVDIATEHGDTWPLAFSVFDYERFLEQGYCANLFALPRDATDSALAIGVSDLFQLFYSALDRGPAVSDAIVHIPGSLGTIPSIDPLSTTTLLAAATTEHLRSRNISAKVANSEGAILPAVRVTRTPLSNSTTIIIPVRNRLSLLQSCLRNIAPAVANTGSEIIIVDNDSADPEMLRYLDQINGRSAKVIKVPGPFNYSRLNNLAVEHAQEECLCLLNNDIEVKDGDWLVEMHSRLAEPDVGAVGTLLLWPSGIVQHGGVVLGPTYAAAHAFNDRLHNDSGYGDLLRVAHECSSVTAACLLTRREDYQGVGGFDETFFPVNFNDVDYCLKLRAKGKRIVFSPHAPLFHLESASRGKDNHPDRAARMERELRSLRAKWGEVLMNDPYYSPILSLDPIPFSALSWPPRSTIPRALSRPNAKSIPAGF